MVEAEKREAEKRSIMRSRNETLGPDLADSQHNHDGSGLDLATQNGNKKENIWSREHWIWCVSSFHKKQNPLGSSTKSCDQVWVLLDPTVSCPPSSASTSLRQTSLKCWGQNADHGQLGLGDWVNRGCLSGEECCFVESRKGPEKEE